jgi:hypothetical protein
MSNEGLGIRDWALGVRIKDLEQDTLHSTPTPYSLLPTPYSSLFTLYSLLFTLYSLLFTLKTLKGVHYGDQ